MTPAARTLLAEFEAAATAASQAEAALRKRMEEEVAGLEKDRAFAFRKLNLMRAVASAVEAAETEEAAVARGLAAVRAELGWDRETETRAETLSRFGGVVRATYAVLAPSEAEAAPAVDVAKTLADFEAWYAETYNRPFWALLEQPAAEIPLVEP
jgi:hypothetical protein